MNEIYFEMVLDIGNLYLEKVFNRFEDENIIFICKDMRGFRYLCICYEFRSSLKWVISKIRPKTLVNLMMKKVDLKGAFEENDDNLIQIIYKDGKEKAHRVSNQRLEENILPRHGVFLKEDRDLSKYLHYICFNFAETQSSVCANFFKYNLDSVTNKINNNVICSDYKDKFVMTYDLSI